MRHITKLPEMTMQRKDPTHQNINKLLSTKKRRLESPSKEPTQPATVFTEFKQGDILFGLLEERNDVSKKIKQQGFHHTVANDLNAPVMKHVFAEQPKEEAINELSKEERQHYEFLRKQRDYLMKQPGKPIANIADPIKSSAFRRACKLLLINREPNRTSKAHFITNNIIWKRTCDKRLSQQGVTDSELRAAYRDYLKHGTNPNIIFYDSQHRPMQQPPWELKPFAHHWRKYDAERAKKLAAKKVAQAPKP